MAVEITLDTSQFDRAAALLREKAPGLVSHALEDIAEEILRLSQLEVPLDIGTLQASGHVEDEGKGKLVGYNTPYAARLHEHPEYHFQHGRKGKYLEDPIKNNKKTLLNYFGQQVRAGLEGLK